MTSNTFIQMRRGKGMKNLILLAAFLSSTANAEGYYYLVPVNPQPLQYLLPPAYIVPPPNYYAPPLLYIQPIQRRYVPPLPDGWGNTKIVPLPPKVDLLPNN